MSAPAYTVNTGAAVALAAATAKTVLAGVAGATGAHLVLCSFNIGFDGVTASALPVLVEVVATAGAGAGSGTSATPVQHHGHIESPAMTGVYNYSGEPTTITVLETYLVDPNKGLLVMQFPLGREPESPVGVTVPSIIGLRCTAPAIVNCRASIVCEE